MRRIFFWFKFFFFFESFFVSVVVEVFKYILYTTFFFWCVYIYREYIHRHILCVYRWHTHTHRIWTELNWIEWMNILFWFKYFFFFCYRIIVYNVSNVSNVCLFVFSVGLTYIFCLFVCLLFDVDSLWSGNSFHIYTPLTHTHIPINHHYQQM